MQFYKLKVYVYSKKVNTIIPLLAKVVCILRKYMGEM